MRTCIVLTPFTLPSVAGLWFSRRSLSLPHRWDRRACHSLIAIVFLLVIARPVGAADITVNASCGIIDALKSAENDTATGGCTAGSGADKITLSIHATLTENPPEITTAITIEGAGYSISGDDKYRFFVVEPSGSLTLNNLTLTNGKSVTEHLMVTRGDFTMTNSAYINSGSGAWLAMIALSQRAGKQAVISNSTFFSDTSEFASILLPQNAAGSFTLSHVTIINEKYPALWPGSKAAMEKINLRNSLLGGASAYMLCQSVGGGSLKQNVGNLILDDSCSPDASGDPLLGGFSGSPGYYPIREDSPANDIGDAAICAAYPKDQAGKSRPATNCNAGAVEAEFKRPPDEDGRDEENGADSADNTRRRSRSTPTPPTPTREPFSTCADFQGPRISVRGYSLSTQCQEVGALGIGNAQVLAGGFIYALDVWGYLGAGVQVCFDKPGRAIVLDAATAPRQIQPLAVYSQDGRGCVDLRRAGTIVLQPGRILPPAALNPDRRRCGPGAFGLHGLAEEPPELPRNAGRDREARAALRHQADSLAARSALDPGRPPWRPRLGQRQLGDPGGRLRLTASVILVSRRRRAHSESHALISRLHILAHLIRECLVNLGFMEDAIP